ncbi:acetylornithine deacetylase [Spongiibacter sp. KMU-166]|uniref:Acetylornithine deacetylase n=1 Tax=Spongiibacter thalassae TaxID=2721624 RepID=A0ABX1GG32_9GAMM|nr:acetylornithine deacetylase [Spongiibacter thalassae]NKI18164.1 acetylornithine deacetylase [Spongiibacter thalassae]
MNTPRLLDMMGQLIALPSVSATSERWDMGNRKVIEQLANWLEPLGFKVRIMPLANPDKANLIATYGSGEGGLVLAGHTDTVPYDEAKWQSDPFTLSERDNRYYGLGSADMKGFFALVIEALKPMLEQNFKSPLIILATADEESSMDGARALVKADLSGARYAIVGEPTGLRPIRAHKGMMMEGITITGRSGHSSNPALGNNALEAMHEVMGALMTLRGQLQQQYHHPGFAVPGPSMNFGCIHGGDNPNRICGQCELHFDIRPVPGMEVAATRERLQQLLTPIAERRKINIGLRELMPGIEAYEQAANSELVQMVEQLTGLGAETVGFATEASFFQKLGMQTIVMGPGHIDQAHQPDEYLGADQITDGITLLQQLIAKVCLHQNKA